MASLAVMGTFLAANAGTIATIATVAGTAITAMGTIASGKAEAKAVRARAQAAAEEGEFEAKQLDVRAKEERAASILEKDELRGRKERVASAAQARAAASGFTATDATSIQIASETESRGTFQEQLALHGGAARASGLGLSAEAKRISGISGINVAAIDAANIKQRSRNAAVGTVVGGLGTSFARFSSFKARTK